MLAASTKVPGVSEPPSVRLVGTLGAAVWAQGNELRHAATVMETVLRVGVRLRYRGRTGRLNFPRWRVPGNALAHR